MADFERILLYAGAGFLGALFIMTRISALRPATAKSMNYPAQPYNPQLYPPYPPKEWIGEHPS